MINLTIQNTIQSTIKNTLGNLSEKFITQLFVPVGSDRFITADNKIFKVRVDMSTLLYLFAEDQRGVWYDPSDLATMYQKSTGVTAVTADGQPVGLMLDKSRGDVLGDEIVTNGTFDTDTSGWSATSGDSISSSGGQLQIVADASGAGYAYQALSLTVGKKYVVSCYHAASSANRYLLIGTAIEGAQMLNLQNSAIAPNATTTATFVATAATAYISVGCYISQTALFDNISIKEVLGIPAQQPISTQRPTYNATPDRLTLDLVDDSLAFTVPTGGIDGYMVVGTNEGTASYGVSLPAGDYDIGGDYFMGGSVNGFLLREGDVSASDLSNVEKDFVSKGAKASYGDVTDFSEYWRSNNLTSFPLVDTSSGTSLFQSWYQNNLTSFPLIDTSNVTSFYGAWAINSLTSFPSINTSSGTNFQIAWHRNNLTSFPFIDTSSGTNFLYTWQGNPNLTDFPANMFDNCNATNFTQAFGGTNLSQSSIDGILVSIESNGTSNGTFGQSGGSAPSSLGEAAIDALRSRGWTITVTGGY